MTNNELNVLMRKALNLATGLKTVEAYDEKRPPNQRNERPYSTLSLHKVKPAAMPTVTNERVGETLESTQRYAAEITFQYTVHGHHAMELASDVHMINVDEEIKRLLFENEVSVWSISEHKRDPQTVGQNYEDSAVVDIIVAAEITRTKIINYADKVDISVYDGDTGREITGSVESKD